MNLMLHGLESPRFFYTDTLSKAFSESAHYDVVLANPPFKGAMDAADVNPTLPAKAKKTEILFLHLFLRLLDNGGRCRGHRARRRAVRLRRAHVEIRRKLIEENRLDGVVSMPGGVFKPYAGVSTAVLLFTKGARPTASGSTTWSTTASRSTTSASPPPRTTSPTFGLLAEPARPGVHRARRPAGRGWRTGRAAEGRAPAAGGDDQPADVRGAIAATKTERFGKPAGRLEAREKPNWPQLASADRAAPSADRPPGPPVLGDEGGSEGQQVRPLGQSLPAGRAG